MKQWTEISLYIALYEQGRDRQYVSGPAHALPAKGPRSNPWLLQAGLREIRVWNPRELLSQCSRQYWARRTNVLMWKNASPNTSSFLVNRGHSRDPLPASADNTEMNGPNSWLPSLLCFCGWGSLFFGVRAFSKGDCRLLLYVSGFL